MADSSAPAPAEAASEAPATAPPLRRWRLAGLVTAAGLAVSAAIHLVLLGTVLVLGSWGRAPAPAKVVPVDVVTEEQLAALEKPDPKPDPKPEKPQPQIPDISSQPQRSQPSAQQSQQPAQPPTPQAQSGASSAAPPPPPPPPSPQPPPSLDAFAPPVAPSDAPAPSAPPPPAPTTGQAAQLAEMLGLPQPVATSGGAPSDYKANLTADAVAGFTSHVQSCWTPPPAAVKDANITVFIRVRLKRDGSLAGPPEPLGGSASMQALTLLQASLNALKSCPAYTALPADKYDEWRVLDLRFTPNGISTAAPVRGNARPG